MKTDFMVGYHPDGSLGFSGLIVAEDMKKIGAFLNQADLAMLNTPVPEDRTTWAADHIRPLEMLFRRLAEHGLLSREPSRPPIAYAIDGDGTELEQKGQSAAAGKMTISEESSRKLDAKVHVHPVLGNAFRLMKDASILMDAGSYASAVALAFLGIEEIGKYLLAEWKALNPDFEYDLRRLHHAKQCAVATMFVVDSARRQYLGKVDFKNMTPGEIAKLVNATQTAMKREKSMLDSTSARAMEYAKQSGMYYDEDRAAKGIAPDKITEAIATSVMQTLSRAFMTIAEEKAVAIGRTFFPLLFTTVAKETK